MSRRSKAIAHAVDVLRNYGPLTLAERRKIVDALGVEPPSKCCDWGDSDRSKCSEERWELEGDYRAYQRGASMSD